MISILIPTYNYDVTQLVSVIHKQVEKIKLPYEIIVCDDASTEKIILEKNKKIKLLNHTQFITNATNLGRTQTRNILATKANYEWLLFLDADVLPKFDDFIFRYSTELKKNASVVYGGICYKKKKPKTNILLRWKYGTLREYLPVKKREETPYFIISQNLLIKKELFFTINSVETNIYGLDILFSFNLKDNKTSVKHIDNPVFHLGLEPNDVFLKKSLQAVKTTFELEKQNLISDDTRALQKSFLALKRWKAVNLFYLVLSPFKPLMKKNILSKHPSIFLFDLYRLHYYIQLKKND